jgi:hypothetical protein
MTSLLTLGLRPGNYAIVLTVTEGGEIFLRVPPDRLLPLPRRRQPYGWKTEQVVKLLTAKLATPLTDLTAIFPDYPKSRLLYRLRQIAEAKGYALDATQNRFGTEFVKFVSPAT